MKKVVAVINVVQVTMRKPIPSPETTSPFRQHQAPNEPYNYHVAKRGISPPNQHASIRHHQAIANSSHRIANAVKFEPSQSRASVFLKRNAAAVKGKRARNAEAEATRAEPTTVAAPQAQVGGFGVRSHRICWTVAVSVNHSIGSS